MNKDLTNRGLQDRSRIVLNESHEVHYWVMTLGIGEDDLRRVVAAVGDTVVAVRARLRSEADPSAS